MNLIPTRTNSKFIIQLSSGEKGMMLRYGYRYRCGNGKKKISGAMTPYFLKSWGQKYGYPTGNLIFMLNFMVFNWELYIILVISILNHSKNK